MLDNLQKLLEAFSKKVVKEARQNLTKQKINASKKLYNSLKYDIKVSKNSLEASLTAEDYMPFIDKGVSGTEKKYNTPFSYKNKRPPASAFDGWMVRKGIAPRNNKGQFTNRKSLGFAIANSVYKKGIKPTNFFTKPLEQNLKNLDIEILETYSLDLEYMLNKAFRNGT